MAPASGWWARWRGGGDTARMTAWPGDFGRGGPFGGAGPAPVGGRETGRLRPAVGAGRLQHELALVFAAGGSGDWASDEGGGR